MKALRKVFAEAKDRYTIMEVWKMLGLPGDPQLGNNLSPLRDERVPSFSIYADGRKFKDQGGDGSQGDIIEFIRVTTDWSYPEIREFLMERQGIDQSPTPIPKAPVLGTAGQRKNDSTNDSERVPIEFPRELLMGSESTWEAFAELRGLSYPGVWVMVQAGVLRFSRIDGRWCFVVTDDARRAAEIRQFDGESFCQNRKAYPLPGVDKSWLPGADLLWPRADILVVEGSTDLLTAYDMYLRYHRTGGTRQWCPMALLGAKCKTIAPELLKRFRGRYVRLVPDPDHDGDIMGENLLKIFTTAGCHVDLVELPRRRDLTDMKDEIEPGELYQ